MKATPAEVKEGGGLCRVYCYRCHDPTYHLVKSGAVPDLRRSRAATYATSGMIVRGGARRILGMPSFANNLTADQARLMQVYVLDQARHATAGP